MTVRGLLSGVRVLDLSGPALAYAGRMLADLGADVLLVEPPGGGPVRHMPPLATTPSGATTSASFAYFAAGKRSVTLAVDSASGQDVFERLLATADVLLVTPAPAHGLLPGGRTYDQVHAAHPRLVVTSVTPFGLRGPRRRWLGGDSVGWAASGALPAIGDPDRAPLVPAGGLASMTGALNAALGTVLALRRRRQSGSGQLVDISLQEAVISIALEAGPLMQMEVLQRQTRTGRRRLTPPMGHYSTKDGAVSIIGYMPAQWDALAAWVEEELGNDSITMDVFKGTPVNRLPYVDIIDPWIEELTLRYTKQEFFEEAQRRGIPAAPVNSVADLLVDPHLEATEAWQDCDDPVLGRVRYPRPPVRFGGEAAGTGPVPAVGEHTHAVLVGELGLSEAELRALVAAGAC